MNPTLAGLTGLQRQLAEFSLTIERSEPDASNADMLNRAIFSNSVERPAARTKTPLVLQSLQLGQGTSE